MNDRTFYFNVSDRFAVSQAFSVGCNGERFGFVPNTDCPLEDFRLEIRRCLWQAFNWKTS